ncbi:MAG: hypothetical protein LBQ86_00620 [Holophagales bacterium]|jgi:hypothetical protein|nr:hypothetical protein [Holophagales bacterium]
MNLSSITPQAVFVGKLAATGREFSILATRNAIDTMQAEGQMMVQLLQQASVGQNVNTIA